MWCGSSK